MASSSFLTPSGACLLQLIFCVSAASQPKPNIVLILTDDQDIELGGTTPLSQASKILRERGAQFTNAFVTTPICCPSRASILTGRYLHNTGVRNNTVSGGCSSSDWREGLEAQDTFAVRLQKAGYTTMYAGKYLNQYGRRAGGDLSHVPNGWNFWAGLVGNSKYYNYTLSVNGKAEVHKDSYPRDYLTDVIRRKAIQFLNKVSRRASGSGAPFLMVLAPPACHAPFTPAPQYKDRFKDVKAPRTPAFDRDQAADPAKHWLLRTNPRQMSNQTIQTVDEVFRNRWRTLLSVDDLVVKVHHALKSFSMLDNTYIILTSDHGYHLGQFGMPLDKRLPYEFDIRVPFWMAGPNITANQTISTPILSIDLAPTLLALADLPTDSGMDGLSFLPLVLPNVTAPNVTTGPLKSLNAIPDSSPEEPMASNISGGIGPDYTGIEGRTNFLVEYFGEGSAATSSQTCSSQLENDLASLAECDAHLDCKCQDARNNTYACIRSYGQENSLFCKFDDTEGFLEMYSLAQDRFQLSNIAGLLQNETKEHYLGELDILKNCKGRECNNV